MTFGSIPPKGKDAIAVWGKRFNGIAIPFICILILFCAIVCSSQIGPSCMSQIQGRYGSDQMIRMLDDHIGPAVGGSGQPQMTFIVDNFPVHLCSPVRDWFSTHDGVTLCVLPPKSMDLMPVHKICDLIVEHTNRQNVDVTSVNVLWNTILENFKKMLGKGLFNSALTETADLAKMICDNNGN